MEQEISPKIVAEASTLRDVMQLVDGRYQLLRLLGRGAVAHVYLAYDQVLHRDVAVKMLTAEAASDPAFVERFRREARAIASLNHPNIVTVYDWGTTGGIDYMVMEYVRGGSLGDLLSHGEPLSEGDALPIAEGVASALAAAHGHHIVHRDIKTDNILLTPERQPKVADFGIAREQGVSALTQTNAVFGTVSYISPEQARGDTVDGRSDIYSLGVVLYQMVTGVLPFRGRSMVDVAIQHVQENPVPPRNLRRDLSPQTNAIIMKALQKHREDRYPNADVMLETLQAALADDPRLLAERVPGRRERATTVRTDALVPKAPARGSGYARPTTHERSWAPLIALPVALLALILGLAFVLHAWSSGRHTASSPPKATSATHRSTSPTAAQGRSASHPSTAVKASRSSHLASPSGSGTKPINGPASSNSTAPQPPRTQPSAPVAVPGSSSPIDAVVSFYTAVGEHRFDDAANMWTPSLRKQDPPSEYITHRFAATRSIWVVPTLGNIDTAAGTAVINVRVTEVTDPLGQTQVLIGTWDLERQNGRWLLNWPTFTSESTASQPAAAPGKSDQAHKKADGHHGHGE